MGELYKTNFTRYQSIYNFVDDNISVWVNNRSNFQEGLKDAGYLNTIMKKHQVEEVKTMEITDEYSGDGNLKFYRKCLQVNNLDLVKE